MDENRNMAAISEKLRAVLSNPGALQALLDTARSAMPMQQAAPKNEDKPPQKASPSSDTVLLRALMPYLSPRRRALLEKLLQMQQLRSLLDGLNLF